MAKKTKLAAISDKTQGELIDMSASMVVDRPLSPDDREVCKQLVIHGFPHFDTLGWTKEHEAEFLSRPNVRRELDRLMGQLQDAPAIDERAKFFSRVRLLQMLPAAMTIVQRVLVGVKNPSDLQELRSLPSEEQYQAAVRVIEWCGLSVGRGGTNINVNVNGGSAADIAPVIDRRMIEGKDEDSKTKYEPARVLARERVREALNRFVRIMASYDDQIQEVTDLRRATKKRKEHTKAKKKRERLEQEGEE